MSSKTANGSTANGKSRKSVLCVVKVFQVKTLLGPYKRKFARNNTMADACIWLSSMDHYECHIGKIEVF